MRCGQWRLKACPKCHGDLFFATDDYEHHWECIQCGCHCDSDDKFAKLPKVDSRWRLVIPKYKQECVK
jgi:transcription initiation factor TFIIIB Brf1 subunit/transcription initiation factor TFIIB